MHSKVYYSRTRKLQMSLLNLKLKRLKPLKRPIKRTDVLLLRLKKKQRKELRKS